MERLDLSRNRLTLNGRCIVALGIIAAVLPPGATAGAQMHSARDTATAYGARLNAKGEPANLNPSRINNRVSNRLETRLSLRVERYRPNSTNDPAAAFAVRSTDSVRVGNATTLSPLSTPRTYDAFSQHSSSQPPLGRTDVPARPR